jgi:hypothetical protein
MDTASELPHDTLSIPRGNGKGKIRLPTRKNLDGRTRARKQFDAIASGVAGDLGGADRLSTVQKHLAEAFAGIAIVVQSVNAKLLAGEEIDITDARQASSTLVRIAARIGVNIVPRDITPTLGDILREGYERQECEVADAE